MSIRHWPVLAAALLMVTGCSFFGSGQRDDWRTHTDMDPAERAVEATLRDIDLCGFVDAKSIKAKIPRAISYGYTEGFDRCTLQLGAFDGGFSSDVSATIGFDLAPERVEPAVDLLEVNGIAVAHELGPTSNRGWCRYVFNLGAADPAEAPLRDGAADLMKRVRVSVVASLSRDPGPGDPVYPCAEAVAIATGAARIRSNQLPLKSGWPDPCSLLADLRGFASYRPGGLGGIQTDLYTCWFSAGPPDDKTANGVRLTLRPVDPHGLDTSGYGEDRRTVVEERDGVRLQVSTVTSKYDKPFCEVFASLGKEYQPTYFSPERARPEDSRIPGAVLRGTSSCDDITAAAVAASKKFSQS